jgi:hypothetical protein
MEPEENITEPEEEVYGCLGVEHTHHMSDEDKNLQRLINEKKKDRTYRVGYPTRSEKPVSEWDNEKIFCCAFPWLFPGGYGDIKGIRDQSINLSEWAENLLYYEDGRFARDKLWCFFTLNYLYRRRNQGQSHFFYQNILGADPPSLEELQSRIQQGDTSTIDKIMYFSKVIPGTTAYWRSKKAELYSWINHHVEQGRGAPTVFMTLSCAEYFWPDLKRLLEETILACEGRKVDLDLNHNELNKAVNDYCIVVQEFFHLRVDAFMKTIGLHVFGLKHYWGRFEFAKSRGQIHLHLLGIIEGVANKDGIYEQVYKFRNDKAKQTETLAKWARETFNLTASLDPNIKVSTNSPNPCTVRFCQTSSIAEDQVSLSNFCHMHKCSEFCLRQVRKTASTKSDIPSTEKEKQVTSNLDVICITYLLLDTGGLQHLDISLYAVYNQVPEKRRFCRSGCGYEVTPGHGDTPGFPEQNKDAIVDDPRGFKKLCLQRNHSRFMQTTMYSIQ